MTVKANYKNNIRVDIRYILNDGREDTYTSRDTVMLLNLSVSDEMKEDGLYPSEYQPITEDGYRIYYNKKYTPPIGGEPEIKKDGTVADIIQNISTQNCKGLFDVNGQYVYQKGEIVSWNGEWWESMESFTEWEHVPGKSRYWKRLNKNWTWPTFVETENKKFSSYSTGDIVMYKGQYFRATQDVWCDNIYSNNDWYNINILLDDNQYNNNCVWQLIDLTQLENKVYPQNSIYKSGNILDIYFPSNLTSIKDPTRNGIDLFDKSKSYKKGDIVKLKNKYNDDTYYDLYFKIDDMQHSQFPSESAESGWMKIDILFSKTSSYAKGVCIKVNPGSFNYWKVAQQNILFDSSLYLEYENQYWMK